MKYLFVLLLNTVLFFPASAQKEVPSFGKIDKADLEMKDCDFDPGAEAVKLFETGNMFYDRGTAGITFLKTMYDKRVRIKILKDKGLTYANVEIPFYSNNNDEKITKIDACTFNLDESGKVKVTDVGKSSIYIKRINKRYSKLIIAFPEAKVGSVIEYRYRLERETYTNIKDWYFQGAIPTRYSEYEVKVPRLFVFSVERSMTGKFDETIKEFDDVITVDNDAVRFKMIKQTFTMRNLVGIKEEPFMASARDYQQHVDFQLSQIDYGNNRIENLRSTWNDVSVSLLKDSDFGEQLKTDIPAAAFIVQQAMQIPDKNERIKFLYNNVRSKMRCDDDEAIFTDEGIVNAWKKNAGNVADINFILIYLLNKSGIKASPILLSTRNNGLINAAYPSTTQFNVVMTFIKRLTVSWC